MDWKQIKEMGRQIANSIRVDRKGWGRTHCPYCIFRIGKADRRASLAFYAPYGFFRCFRCSVKFTLGEWTPAHAPVAQEPTYHREDAPDWYHPLFGGAETTMTFSAATKYAEGRGYDLALRQAVKMGACATGRYNTRIIIPHVDVMGNWWGFTARTWYAKAEEPYLYPPGMDRTRMFNEQALAVETSDPVLGMEGVSDGILFWPDAVTSGGKPIPDQLAVFQQAKRPVAFVLDGDAWRDGWYAALRLQAMGAQAGCVRLPPGRDPNDRFRVSGADIRRAAIECIGKLQPVAVDEIEDEKETNRHV